MKNNPVDNHIKFPFSQDGLHGRFVANVALQALNARRHAATGLTAIEQAKLHPALNGKLSTSRANDAGATDEENLQIHWSEILLKWKQNSLNTESQSSLSVKKKNV
ncbi:MAG: hypothetical protein ALAOOOJD_02133 [bacterium]|nr:hypothetical protein [bacterium]